MNMGLLKVMATEQPTIIRLLKYKMRLCEGNVEVAHTVIELLLDVVEKQQEEINALNVAVEQLLKDK